MSVDMHVGDKQVQAYIVRVTDDNVVIDLNHPLAGERIHFDVNIQSVRTGPKDISHAQTQ